MISKGGIVENKNFLIPNISIEPIKKMTTEEIIDEINKAINNPNNNSRCFVSLATVDVGSISKTMNGGI